MDLKLSHLYSTFSALMLPEIFFDGDESVFFNGKPLDMLTPYSAFVSNKRKQEGYWCCNTDRIMDQKPFTKNELNKLPSNIFRLLNFPSILL